VEELLAQVAGDVAAASHAEFWPDDKNALLLCSPAQNDRVNEEVFPRPGGLPLGVSYADLDRFNAIFSSIKGDIARGQGWTGGTSDNTPFFFTILSKNTYERMEERYGNTFGYYAPDHYYKKLVKYQVLIDSDKQGLPFCDFREFQSAPYGEMEVLSVFNGVWVDLPSFVESLLATWLDYWGDFGKMRLCKQCAEIFFSDRAGDERGFFCPKEFGTNCQQSYHASSDAVRCRERNCKRIGRKISQLEVWLDKRLFVDKLTTDICKGGRCPFDGKSPIESDCPHLLEANRKCLDMYEAEKAKR
jgi:hypothetical protein